MFSFVAFLALYHHKLQLFPEIIVAGFGVFDEVLGFEEFVHVYVRLFFYDASFLQDLPDTLLALLELASDYMHRFQVAFLAHALLH